MGGPWMAAMRAASPACACVCVRVCVACACERAVLCGVGVSVRKVEPLRAAPKPAPRRPPPLGRGEKGRMGREGAREGTYLQRQEMVPEGEAHERVAWCVGW